MQDLRNKRESELQELKRTLDSSQQQHEMQVQDVRARYSQQVEVLAEEVENTRKVRAVLTELAHSTASGLVCFLEGLVSTLSHSLGVGWSGFWF